MSSSSRALLTILDFMGKASEQLNIKTIPFGELGDQDRGDWRKLLSEHSFPNPLNDPDYLQCLANAGRDIGVIRVTENDRPIVFWPYEKSGRSGIQPVALSLSDCSQFIAASNVTIEPGLILKQAGFSHYDFDHLFHQNSFDASKFSYCIDPCYMIRLDGGFDSYLLDFTIKGSRLVAQTNRKKRKLENELGPVRLEPATPDHSLLQMMLDWKIDQLDQQGMRHSFREGWTVQFMSEHLQLSSDYCQGKLSVLYAGDQVVAMHYGSWGYGSINSWLPSINPAFAKFSPASILYLELARFGSDNGIHTIILGRGDNQTKTRLANGTVVNHIGRIQTGIIGKTRNWGMRSLYGFLRSRLGRYVRGRTRGQRK